MALSLVVTSNYHTRRARLVWEGALKDTQPGFQVSIRGVSDGSFEARGWWRHKIYAKTWILEVTKLIWTYCFGRSTAG